MEQLHTERLQISLMTLNDGDLLFELESRSCCDAIHKRW